MYNYLEGEEWKQFLRLLILNHPHWVFFGNFTVLSIIVRLSDSREMKGVGHVACVGET
jgi:hypothetical protein